MQQIETLPNLSAGVPLTYYHSIPSSQSIENLTINFLTTPFSTTATRTYRKTGFLPYQTLTEIFANKYTAIYESDTEVKYQLYDSTVTGTKKAGSLKVRSITIDDIKAITGSSTSGLSGAYYQNLFKVDAYYWLASAYSTGGLWLAYLNGELNYRRKQW